MKRFIIVACVAVAIALAGSWLVAYRGVDLWLFGGTEQPTAQVKTEGRQILLESDGQWRAFQIRGVDVGGSVPGHFATDYAVDKSTYLRWFQQIKDMGANTVRVYMLMGSDFYEAFWEFNQNSDDPLYLLQGVYLDDYAGYSHMDAYDRGYYGYLQSGAFDAIDAVHGRKYVELGQVSGTGSYVRDVSPWVIGYAVGVPWDTRAVVYTNDVDADLATFEGEYFSAGEDATAFEAMLARLADDAVRYESDRYGQQRLIGIVNSPTTDPFDYPQDVAEAFNKYAKVDVEHIVAGDGLESGMFALYHVYPFDPDFARYLDGGDASQAADAQAEGAQAEGVQAESAQDGLGQAAAASEPASFSADPDGNTFRPYLEALVQHHSCPVVVGEWGLPTSRGVGYDGGESGRDQGGLSEDEQARLMVETYRDIVEAGCAGSLAYEWQDEWGRRTWNTVYSTDQLRTPFWSDAQTADQGYGIMAFDPGEQRSVCYVDGDDEEWAGVPVVSSQDDVEVQMLCDERYVYFRVAGQGVEPGARVALPIGTTGKSGSTTAACLSPDFEGSGILTYDELADQAEELPVSFSDAADFLVVIDGDRSCLYVQERYDAARAMMLRVVEGRDPYTSVPSASSPLFKPVRMAQKTLALIALEQPLPTTADGIIDVEAMTDFQYDLTDAMARTGKLREGDANPSSSDYDSLADYSFGDGFVEIRLPWQMLNFSDPSTMKIHDDYYEHYGVEDQVIDCMRVGACMLDAASGDGEFVVDMQPFALQGWGDDVSTHERLKAVYYALRDEWAAEDAAAANAKDAAAQAAGDGATAGASAADAEVADGVGEPSALAEAAS